MLSHVMVLFLGAIFLNAFYRGIVDLLCFSRSAIQEVQFSSVAQSCLILRPQELQHARTPCPSPTPRVYSNSCPLSQLFKGLFLDAGIYRAQQRKR